MSRKKCPICGEWSAGENMVKIGGRYYHKGECENIENNKVLEKNKDRESWDKLFGYICLLYNINKPTGMMFKQMETFRKEYDYTNDGMYETLKYYYEVLGNEVVEGTGLGIIPYYYEQMKKHLQGVWEVEDYMEDFVNKEQVKLINIKPFNNTYQSKKQIIKLEDVVWEEDDE